MVIVRWRHCVGRSGNVVADRRAPIGGRTWSRGTRFRVWAPAHRVLDVGLLDPSAAHMAGVLVVWRRQTIRLAREMGGYFSGFVPGAAAGDLYFSGLEGGSVSPDPACRFQPVGPFGPSEIVDPGVFAWTDGAWQGAARHEHVIYEIFDAEAPFTPRGCIAQARSVAELIRAVAAVADE